MGEGSFGRVAVLGAGTMGQGIAQVCAQAGATVTLYDVAPEALARARAAIETSLGRLVAKGKLSADVRDGTLARLREEGSVATAVDGCDAVLEAVPENLDLKRKVFQAVDERAPEGCLLGTNTSSLSVTELANALRDPSRLVGMHFFNPVPVMDLLEIVRGVRTSDHTVLRARTFSGFVGKTAIEVRDYPGFATSRLGVLLGAEAIRMLETGVASAEDIDRAMELGYRHPMGPLRLTDLVGLDVRLAILEHLHRELGEQFRPPALLRQLVRAGKLGKKTGEGFYRWG